VTESRIAESLAAVVLTRDEAPNIGRCLEKLRWVPQVIVVDSFSTDDTVAIARSFSNVKVVQRKFDTHEKQWNYGVEQVKTDWVLALDTDYILSDELTAEVRGLRDDESTHAYEAQFVYCIHGRPLRGTLYTPTKILFRRALGRYVQEGHTQRLQVEGSVGRLTGRVHHDDHKPLSRWLRNQLAYAKLEAGHLRTLAPEQRALSDKFRLCLLMPVVVPFYCLLVQRGLLDGWPGVYYALQRTLAEVLIALDLLDNRLRGVRL